MNSKNNKSVNICISQSCLSPSAIPFNPTASTSVTNQITNNISNIQSSQSDKKKEKSRRYAKFNKESQRGGDNRPPRGQEGQSSSCHDNNGHRKSTGPAITNHHGNKPNRSNDAAIRQCEELEGLNIQRDELGSLNGQSTGNAASTRSNEEREDAFNGRRQQVHKFQTTATTSYQDQQQQQNQHQHYPEHHQPNPQHYQSNSQPHQHHLQHHKHHHQPHRGSYENKSNLNNSHHSRYDYNDPSLNNRASSLQRSHADHQHQHFQQQRHDNGETSRDARNRRGGGGGGRGGGGGGGGGGGQYNNTFRFQQHRQANYNVAETSSSYNNSRGRGGSGQSASTGFKLRGHREKRAGCRVGADSARSLDQEQSSSGVDANRGAPGRGQSGPSSMGSNRRGGERFRGGFTRGRRGEYTRGRGSSFGGSRNGAAVAAGGPEGGAGGGVAGDYGDMRQDDRLDFIEGLRDGDFSANQTGNAGHIVPEGLDLNTQRGQLIDQLCREKYECMVCMELILSRQSIWSCSNCWHGFHLKCVRKWSSKECSKDEEEQDCWRCPGCQHANKKKCVYQYRCFCGKEKEPAYNPNYTPHSCGELCMKSRLHDCPHKCNLLCHPGPCPPCSSSHVKTCFCKRTSRTIRCGSGETFTCIQVCNKLLNCGRHFCKLNCHEGSCKPCNEAVQNDCYCGKDLKINICGSKESRIINFSCKQVCDNILKCTHHRCKQLCHPGECSKCHLGPDELDHCPCGQRELSSLTTEVRKSCSDTIVCCDNICNKEFNCGPQNKRHRCPLKCHENECLVCDKDTQISCRCGRCSKDISCRELLLCGGKDSINFLCKTNCNRKMKCGKHKCKEICCNIKEHTCAQRCGMKLTCGLHYCDDTCHSNKCQTCWNVNYSEMSCYCGSEVLFPPIPCGTKPPKCDKLCTRPHPCNHPVRHTCQSDDHTSCSPCTELVCRVCMCGRVTRKSIPCHLVDISCGLPCNKKLRCGHDCPRICHKDACDSEPCRQPCTEKRSDCEHICNEPCNQEHLCCRSLCKKMVTLHCRCKLKTDQIACFRVISSRKQRFTNSINSDLGNGSIKLKFDKEQENDYIECDNECLRIERNKRIAVALQISSPHLAGKPSAPLYPAFVVDYAKKNKDFILKIEKNLVDFVKKTQQSTEPLKQRHMYSFAVMNKDQRRCIHELSVFYGVQTTSYDNEPNKNVVAYSYRNKCCLPSMGIFGNIHSKNLPVNGKEEIKAFKDSLEVSATKTT